jgi:carbonic anhydrase
MESWKRLLLENKAWSQGKQDIEPDYFTNLATENPEFMWIGCSDARVPAEEITGSSPGELFVHRNVANMVVHTDLNLLTVLQFAVEYLEVQHIIVCGHYGCGGVKAALGRRSYGLINTWLAPIKDTYRHHRDELEMLDPEAAARRMVELNVARQLTNLARTDVVQRAWRDDQRPMLHGWVYDMQNGLINPMVRIGPGQDIDAVYRFDEGL